MKDSVKCALDLLYDDKIYLSKFGVSDDPSQHNIEPFLTESSLKNISDAIEQIPEIWTSRKTINKCSSSYGLKHVLERYRKKQHPGTNSYISNGEFIVAMGLAGYFYKKKKGYPNIFFNISSNYVEY